MITFTDDHEAELWRSVAAGMIVTLSVAPSSPGPLDIAAHAGLFADAAVLEYRKRCGQPAKNPDINPGCIWCEPSFKCWASAAPCVKVAKCPTEERR